MRKQLKTQVERLFRLFRIVLWTTAIWPIAISFALSAASPLFGASPDSEVITKISEILALDPEDAARAYPVELVAKVYYFDPEWRFFFIGQDDDFICIDAGQKFIPIGTTIRLTGKTGSGNRKNVIDFGSMQLLETGPPDDPLSVTFSESTSNRFDCHWVTGECVVVAARTDSRRTVLECRSDDYEFSVAIPSVMSAEDLLPLIDSRIRITGNVGSNFDDDVYVGTEICSPPDHIEIVEPAEHPLRFVERRSVEDLWNDEHARNFHLFGQVTFVGKGGFFIENNASGMWVFNDRDIPFRNGMYVDIFGTRERDRSLLARAFENRGSTTLSRPETQTIGNLKAHLPESCRIRVDGSLVRVRYGERCAELSMEGDDGTPFCVYLPIAEEQLVSMDLDTAVNLSVTGTASFVAEEPFEFAIYSPSQDEIVVKKRKPVMSRGRVLGMLAVFGPLLAFVVVWGHAHRQQARDRKKDLEQITAELRLSFDSIRDGVLILDRELNVAHANEKVCEFTGISLSPGESLTRFETSLLERLVEKRFIDDWNRLNQDDTLSEEFSLELELSGERRSLEVFTAPVKNDDGRGVARLWAFHDVTERQQLHASLLHAQKQEAIGRLAGGFAHDFNNLLTGVIGSLSVASLDKEKTVGEVIDHLKTAEGASERAATLVSQLLGFSRKTRLHLKPNDVNSIIVRMEPLLRPVLNSVQVSFQLDDDIPTVRVDATQLEQVLLNICLNACDAIDESGQIFVRSYAKQIEKKGAERLYVVVSIRDTGPGIADNIREKIFEPFFTTKQGKGTGLGLAMAEGIVHQHEGWVECDSAIGVGTEFRVYLPACNVNVSVSSDPVAKPIGSLANRTVLVVDDEEVVRRAMSAILRQQGADVHIVPDGEQAVSMLQKHDFDIVLLDWTMPLLSGRETLQQIKKLQPSLPVVICSGFAFNVDEINRRASVAPDEVVQKPFNAEKITQIVLKVLDRADSRIEKIVSISKSSRATGA